MISRLYFEHNHIRKTINLLEIQLIELCRYNKINYDMLYSLIVYLQEYPEASHHPIEDDLYSALLKLGLRENDIVRSVIKDHTELEKVTRYIRLMVEKHRHSKKTDQQELVAALSEFITRQRQHLYAEEMYLYPLVIKYVTDSEYVTIESHYSGKGNKIFGARTNEDYEALERKLESSDVKLYKNNNLTI